MSDSATLQTVARQALLSMGFSRQEYLSELPHPPPDLPDPGIERASLKSPALAGMFFTGSARWEALQCYNYDQLECLILESVFFFFFPQSKDEMTAYSQMR